MKRFFRPWLHLDFVYYRTKSGKMFKEETDRIDNNFKNVRELEIIVFVIKKHCIKIFKFTSTKKVLQGGLLKTSHGCFR